MFLYSMQTIRFLVSCSRLIFYCILIFSVLGCDKKIKIPDDKEIIDNFADNQATFEKYANLFLNTPDLQRIELASVKGKPHIYSTPSRIKFEQDGIVDDLAKRLKVDLIVITSYRDVCCSKPNEIAFYAYRSGFAKGVAYVSDATDLSLVNSLELYGTENSPRRKTDGKPRRVYRHIRENWYLFAT